MIKSFLPLLLLFAVQSVLSQETFISKINIGAYEHYSRNHIIATEGGGWVISGNFHSLTGNFFPNGFFILKYNSCGKLLWGKEFDKNLSVQDLKLSGNGEILLAGSLISSLSREKFLLKLDKDGNSVFGRKFNIEWRTASLNSLSLDESGNIFLTGDAHNNSADERGFEFVIKFNSEGNYIWHKGFDVGGYWGYSLVTKDGGVLIDSGRGFLYKINSNGKIEWAKYGYYGGKCEPIEV
ncbi:MAG: PQQ-like beta-propeller repeat protein, partial [Bacteroidetes bacterium]|nr:PQQ-like beta-propeller repeat protein [Bacteroidota bacterium]